VEPNSRLGQALTYLLKHWESVTRFLTVPGAPLDNNAAEVRLVGQKPNTQGVWGIDPGGLSAGGLQNLIPVSV
jgi:transposase